MEVARSGLWAPVASHQCWSLLLVLSLVLRGFRSPQSGIVNEELLCGCATTKLLFIYLFIYLSIYLFIHLFQYY